MRKSRENNPSDSNIRDIREKSLRAALAGTLALSAAFGLGACDEKASASNEPAPIETTQSEVTPQSTPAETAPVQESEPQEELADLSEPILPIDYSAIYTAALNDGGEWNGTIYNIADLVSGLNNVPFVDLHNIVGEFMNRNIEHNGEKPFYEPFHPDLYHMKNEEDVKLAANNLAKVIDFMQKLQVDSITGQTPPDFDFGDFSRVVAVGFSADNESARLLEEFWTGTDSDDIYNENGDPVKSRFEAERDQYSTVLDIAYLGEVNKINKGDPRVYANIQITFDTPASDGTTFKNPKEMLITYSPGGVDYGGRS